MASSSSFLVSRQVTAMLLRVLLLAGTVCVWAKSGNNIPVGDGTICSIALRCPDGMWCKSHVTDLGGDCMPMLAVGAGPCSTLAYECLSGVCVNTVCAPGATPTPTATPTPPTPTPTSTAPTPVVSPTPPKVVLTCADFVCPTGYVKNANTKLQTCLVPGCNSDQCCLESGDVCQPLLCTQCIDHTDCQFCGLTMSGMRNSCVKKTRTCSQLVTGGPPSLVLNKLQCPTTCDAMPCSECVASPVCSWCPKLVGPLATGKGGCVASMNVNANCDLPAATTCDASAVPAAPTPAIAPPTPAVAPTPAGTAPTPAGSTTSPTPTPVTDGTSPTPIPGGGTTVIMPSGAGPQFASTWVSVATTLTGLLALFF